jgi:hypothetical protein
MMRRLLLTALGLGVCGCRAAPSPAHKALEWNAADSANIALLQSQGRRMAGRQVVVYALPAEMTEAWQAALLDSLDRGVTEMRRMMGAPLPWQRIGGRPVQFYLVPERVISHASGKDVVFVSMFRVRDGRAPYLHEAAHELLAPPAPFFYDEQPDTVTAEATFQAMPYWLMEGLPDVMAQQAATVAGTREGDVFAIGGPAKADSTCAARLADNPFRAELLRTLGGSGAVDQLFTTDRMKVAPAFYACAQSISRFVADLIGMPRAVTLFPAIKRGDWPAQLENMAGMSLDSLRGRWQARLGIVP